MSAETSNSEPVTVKGCVECGREYEAEQRELLRGDGLL
jgi:hypothetical protein